MPGIGELDQSQVKNFLADPGQESKKPNQPMLVDLVTLERIYLQTIPNEIEISPEANFVNVGSVGRNVPNYHFTGGEDVVTFTINWYSNTDDITAVIRKCKFVESLSRNDGNNRAVHPIKFIFGKLYLNATFIMFSAPYRLMLFDRPKGMYPNLAAQLITLKRISTLNPTRAEILNPNY